MQKKVSVLIIVFFIFVITSLCMGTLVMADVFPVTITDIKVIDGIVTGMEVEVTDMLNQNGRGIVAVYNKDGQLLELRLSVDYIDSNVSGTQSLNFSPGMTIDEGETLRGFVWSSDSSMLPLADTFTYISDGIIHLKDDRIVAYNIPNVSIDGTVVTISAAGTYTVEGNLTDGQIVVAETVNKDAVEIILNGVSISSSTNSPFCAAGGKITLTLADGTVNTFTDTSIYVADVANACLYSKRDLTIKGSGNLIVNGNFNNGIGSKADLKINGGNITVIAVNNGLKGNQSIVIKDATVDITSVGDGIKSDNTATGEGTVKITSGEVNIKSSSDGIQATNTITVSGGSLSIDCAEDAMNCSIGTTDITSGNINISGGTINIISVRDGIQADNVLDITGGIFTIKTGGGYNGASTTDSCKGLKGVASISISGGTFNINSKDGAVHTDANVTISGGNFEIYSSDDGVHADETLTISGDNTVINIKTCYEGLEAMTINVAGGNIHIIALDDGINASGGTDQTSTPTRPGGGVPPNSGSGNGLINITGGYLVIDSTGDGIDANGNITMSGGTVIVNGPTSDKEAPIDYDGTFVMTGGFIVAAGSSGMAQAPGTSSTQRAVKITYKSSQVANTLMNIQNANGNSILTFKPSKKYSSIVLCAPSIVSGATYNIYSGGSYEDGTVTDGLYNDGTYSGGTLKGSFNSLSVVTNINVN